MSTFLRRSRKYLIGLFFLYINFHYCVNAQWRLAIDLKYYRQLPYGYREYLSTPLNDSIRTNIIEYNSYFGNLGMPLSVSYDISNFMKIGLQYDFMFGSKKKISHNSSQFQSSNLFHMNVHVVHVPIYLSRRIKGNLNLETAFGPTIILGGSLKNNYVEDFKNDHTEIITREYNGINLGFASHISLSYPIPKTNLEIPFSIHFNIGSWSPKNYSILKYNINDQDILLTLSKDQIHSKYQDNCDYNHTSTDFSCVTSKYYSINYISVNLGLIYKFKSGL